MRTLHAVALTLSVALPVTACSSTPDVPDTTSITTSIGREVASVDPVVPQAFESCGIQLKKREIADGVLSFTGAVGEGEEITVRLSALEPQKTKVEVLVNRDGAQSLVVQLLKAIRERVWG